jgi:uncharacterized protein YutE (UPF0331/DUF86 family)
MVRPELVRRKLQLIAEDLGRLVEFRGDTLESLGEDFIRMAALERIIERIVSRAIDVNMHLISELAVGDEEKITRITYRESFMRLTDLQVCPSEVAERVSRSAGLRNILVHDYNDVDRSILHCSIEDCLRDFTAYVECVDGFIAGFDG